MIRTWLGLVPADRRGKVSTYAALAGDHPRGGRRFAGAVGGSVVQ
jgi:hypothetical protein